MVMTSIPRESRAAREREGPLVLAALQRDAVGRRIDGGQRAARAGAAVVLACAVLAALAAGAVALWAKAVVVSASTASPLASRFLVVRMRLSASSGGSHCRPMAGDRIKSACPALAAPRACDARRNRPDVMADTPGFAASTPRRIATLWRAGPGRARCAAGSSGWSPLPSCSSSAPPPGSSCAPSNAASRRYRAGGGRDRRIGRRRARGRLDARRPRAHRHAS